MPRRGIPGIAALPRCSQGLSILAKAVGVVGVEFDTQEQASTQTVDGVYRG